LLQRQRLLAVADGEDRHARIKDGLRRARAVRVGDRGRTTGEDHAFRLQLLECGGCILERMDLAIDAGFAEATRDQLRYLRSKIDNENAVGHGSGPASEGNGPSVKRLRRKLQSRSCRS